MGNPFTSKASGNWSATGQTTWNEVGAPGDGDWVTIASGHTVTVDGAVTVGTAGPNGYATTAPTVSPTAGGSATSLPTGNYFVLAVPVDAGGVEGSPSPESAVLTVTNGVSTPRIALGTLPAGAASWSVYLTNTGTAAAGITHRRYATGKSAGNFEPVSASWEDGSTAFASARLLMPASAIRAIGILNIGGAGALTLKGDVWTQNTSGTTVSAGGSITFNVASGLTYGWRGGIAFGAYSPLILNGSTGSHCTVTKTGSGTAIIGYTTNFDANSIVQPAFTDFSNLGSASVNAISSALPQSTRTVSYADCTFDNCGRVSVVTQGANDSFDFIRCKVTNSLHSTDSLFHTTSASIGTGTRRILNSTFDKRVNVDGRGFTIEDNYFRGDIYPSGFAVGRQWASFKHNFACQKFLIGQPAALPYDISDCILFVDKSAVINPHPWDPAGVNQDVTWSGVVFDGVHADNSGDILLLQTVAPGASNYTFTITNSLYCQSIIGDNIGTPLTAYGNAKLKWVFNHNTYCMGIQGVSFAEAGPGYTGFAGMCQSFQSNIAWNTAKGTQGWVLWDALRGDPFDAVPGYFVSNAVDYNGKWNYSTTAYSTSWDAVAISRGYACGDAAGSFYPFGVGIVPGNHDVDSDPQFVDKTRCVASFDRGYLGRAAGTAWADATAYAVGDIVSATTAGIYSGQTINYRCVTAHTSSSGDTNLGKPGLGAAGVGNTKAWSDYWELASQYEIRQSLLAGTTYTDSSIGVTSKSIVEVCRKWILGGFATTNTLYRNAGHDGATLGAIEGVFASGSSGSTGIRLGSHPGIYIGSSAIVL